MKNRLRLIPALLFTLALAPSLIAGPFADSAQPYVDDGTIPGAVFLAASGDKILASEAAGLADIAGGKQMREDTLFWIASMTKPMTAAAFMMLVDEGKVSLDDPVSKYIPAFNAPQKIVPKESEKLGSVANFDRTPGGAATAAAASKSAPAALRKNAITLRHLLSHTAGFPYSAPEEKPTLDLLPLDKAAGYYAAGDLLFEPGSDYSYANTDINTIGRVIEIVSGMPYEVFLQKRLLDPLGMTDTTFWPDAAQLARLATSYKGDPKKRTLTAEPIALLHSPLDDRARRHAFPGGGLFSTAADVARFGQLLLNKGVFQGKRLLSEAAVAEMIRRQTPPAAKTAYGLGINIQRDDRFGHGGAYATYFSVWPEDNLVTVFMVQKISKWGGPDGGKIRPAFEKQARELARSAAKAPPRLRRDQSFLGIHFDFHAGRDCTEVGKNTTPEMVNRIIDLVRPDYIQVDSKGHPGYSSYPTKVGNRAPGFAGPADPLRVWRDTTARRGVALYAHHSGVWDERAVALHPEWAAVNADGAPDKRKTSVFGDYDDLLLIPQLKELAGDYALDGAWVDGECWATIPDYSPRAQKRFTEATGIKTIPKNSKEPHWHEWLQFHREAFRRHVRRYAAAVRSEFPDFQICSNWAFTHHMPEAPTVALDFLSGDLSAKNALNSARFAARYLAPQGVPWDLMAWSFSGYLEKGGFKATAQKTIPQLQREAAAVLALGGGFQAYFTQNRDGSVRLGEMDAMAAVAAFARARQPWTHRTQQIPQVALIFSSNDYQHSARGIFPQYNARAPGILQALLESQYSVDLINEETLGPPVAMSRYPLVVLPEWSILTDTFREDLLAYVRSGGSLLVVGKKAAGQFAALAGTALPESGGVTTAITQLGAGKLALIHEDVGIPYATSRNPAQLAALREKLAQAARSLFPTPLVEVTGSPYVDVSVSRPAPGDGPARNATLLIQLVNTGGDHADAGIIETITRLGPLTLAIRAAQKPARITLQPSTKILPFTYESGVATVIVPALEIHETVVVE